MRLLLLLPLAAAALTAPAPAAETMLPVAQQVPLLLKVVTYEKTLMQPGATALTVGVLYDPDAPDSRRQFEEFERELRPYADKTVRGHAVVLVAVPWASWGKGDLPSEAAGVSILYVPPGDPSIVPLVCRWTRARKILSATPVASYVEDGLTLGLVVRNGRTGVTINRKASLEEGKVWSEDFLRLCRIIE
jgi:hypothetical protein